MTHFDQNDPRLTAFALGELNGAERAEFETHVASCGECARLVEELRQLGELVTAGLRHDGAVPEKLTQLPLQVASKEPVGRWDRRRVFAYATAASLAGVIVGGAWLVPTGRQQMEGDLRVDRGDDLSRTSYRERKLTQDKDRVFLNFEDPKVGPYLNFEDPQDMLHKEKLIRAEIARREAAAKAGDASKSAIEPKGNEAERVGTALAPASLPTVPNVPLSRSGSLPTATSPGTASASKSENHFYMPAAAAPAPTVPQPAGPAPNVSLPKAYHLQDDVGYVPPQDPLHFKLNREQDSSQATRERPGWQQMMASVDNTESYARIHDNPFLDSKTNPLSTFSIDVDTGSYSNVRRFLTVNQLPPPDAVRIEELLNYFSYDYAPPTGEHPFAAHVEVASAPWMPAHRLVRVGIKGKVVTREQRPAANLVFLIDVSGSMSSDNKLPLVKKALKLLVEQLDEKDRVSLVVYAGASGLVLDTTPAYQKETILTAIDRLQSGGSTNGGAGIQLAYAKATEAFIKEGVNRVILATDGDFNVGVTNQGELTRLIEKEAKSGVFLSVLGFGMGNLKDATLEQLADKGNGTYGYIDTFAEARKVFVEQVNGTLVTIAKDVKIQIEFNPAQVASYRLIGYENRLLRKEDFNDDTKDAGEIGAGHTVTALYEVVPVGVNTRPANPATPAVDPLKYQTPAATPMPVEKLPDAATAFDELLTLKLRYKQPDGDKSALVETPVKDSKTSFEQASGDLRFAASVAAFGMRLRGSEHAGDISWTQIIDFARRATGEDANGYRHEFVTLAEQAAKLSGKK